MKFNNFNKKELDILAKAGSEIVSDKEYSDHQIIEIIEAVEAYLLKHCINGDDSITAEGILCEGILDKLSGI